MPTPDFILTLRERIGHDLLFLSGVSGVVVDDGGRLLLGRRSDVGRWALPSGILEPGEQPAAALVREVEEETAVRVEVVGLVSVWTQEARAYPNGDAVQFLDLCFRCRYVAGEARVNDDESTEVGWFDRDRLPAGLTETARAKIGRALEFDNATWFEPAPSAVDSAEARIVVAPPAEVS